MRVKADHQLVKSRILNAARCRIRDVGYASTRTLDVAQDARVSETSVLRLFRTKSGMLQALHSQVWEEELWPVVDAAVRHAGNDPSDQLVAIGSALWLLYDSDRRDMLILGMANCVGGDVLVSRDISLAPTANMRYVALVDGLCRRVVAWRRAPVGFGAESLREAFLGMVDSVVVGWHFGDKAGDPGSKIKFDDAVVGLRALVDQRIPMEAEPLDSSARSADGGRNSSERRLTT